MDAELHDLIVAFHQSRYRCVLAITGGGAGAASLLLSVPGGSRSILEAIIPYGENCLTHFLGNTPPSYCSSETTRRMARRALERARWLSPGELILGAACTASLASDRPKRGDHRFYIVLETGSVSVCYSLTLLKEARSREAEEIVLDLVFLNGLAEVVGIDKRVPVPLLEGETIQRTIAPREHELAALISGHIPTLLQEIDGTLKRNSPPPKLLLCGSFNPLHKGHCTLAKVASDLEHCSAAFELGILNADKPPLSQEEVRRRMVQFTWRAPLWLSRAATFLDKAELFPGTVFIVGADTAERILQARFYGDSEARRDQALARLCELGCRFLVAARLNAQGALLGLSDLAIPAACANVFAPIPVERFRLDLSSTQLRTILN